ncbi:winged helix-turn-helix domain-containing protein [Kitasatospora sp. LaBMicrA B282]|uniref:winged helix-turn-helix domain-containing protein n=1 Tax=Kitasatospora sp. LaBMicrA B282 TaxID=3420949 RepID=UPI003D111237
MSSSSSSAVLTPPTATPHLRAVRSVAAPAGTARHAAGAPVQLPTVLPSTVPAPVPAQFADQWPVAPELFGTLPEGAVVAATLPQSALPAGLLAQYRAQLGAAGAAARPMVGYLVLAPAPEPVPAQFVPAPVVPAAVPPAVPAAEPQRGPRAAAQRGIGVDLERRNAFVDGVLLDLTYLEFELLAHLTQYPQRVHTRDHLVSAVWGYGHVGDGRTVDVHVARLRRKLGPGHRDSIVTVRRVGYKYAPIGRP